MLTRQFARPRAPRAPAPAPAPAPLLRPARSLSIRARATAEIADAERARELNELRQLFATFDTDGNGTIDRTELKRLLNTVDQGTAVLLAYESFLTDDDVDAAFARYDADGSGALDFDEFQRLIEDGLLLSEPLTEYERLFRAADTSGNGTLGAAELKKLLAAMGRSDVSDDRLVELFAEYDLDGSGQVELREFLRMCARRLLDVRALQEWMRSRPGGGAGGGAADDDSAGARAVATLLEGEDGAGGDVTVIFSAEELEEAIQRPGVVVLMAGLSWCRPCKGVASAYAKLAKHYEKAGLSAALKVYGNANDRTKAVFKRLKIRSTPAFVFFKGGEVIGAATGGNKAKLESAIREVLGGGGDQAAASLGERLYPAPEGAVVGSVLAGSGSE